MGISEEQVRHIAKLSRIELTDEKVKEMAKHLSAKLDYISKLNELDVEGVEPLGPEMTNVFREDVVTDPLSKEEVFKNAPDHDGEHFKVPKVLDEAEPCPMCGGVGWYEGRSSMVDMPEQIQCECGASMFEPDPEPREELDPLNAITQIFDDLPLENKGKKNNPENS